MVSIDDFNEVKECAYKEEHYSVRDNGAIMRHQREGMRIRKLDNVWSFGNPNDATGYMDFCGERVHRIVATAFHGDAPSDQHVVDHIDTNRRNNRPENLRWLTKLENILCNEITRKKVELICGSIENFLKNPQLLYGYEKVDKNFFWMRSVSKEETHYCLDHWSHWAKTAKPDPNYKKEESHIDVWMYNNSKPIHFDDNPLMSKDNYETNIDTSYDLQYDYSHVPEKTEIEEDEIPLHDSLTSSAKQRFWRTPTEFPCCPLAITEDGLNVYMKNLTNGAVFSSNKYGISYVVDRGINKESNILFVLTSKGNDNEFLSSGIVAITIENGKYIHESVKATAGLELTTKYYKYLIGEGELTDEDIDFLDCI